ncbi:MAG TPA: alpha/beta hydrolase, partial [Segetibacter sp.]
MEKMFLSVFLVISFFSFGQNITYPYPVNYFNLDIEGQNVKMAFMDVKPSSGNSGTVLLFHGKNFNGFYWKDVIPF